MSRRNVTRLAASLLGVLAALTLAAPPSGAAPQQVPRIASVGDNFGFFGDHAFCRGAVNVSITSPKRGVARLTLTSHGFTGQGREWSANPNCKTLLIVTHTSANAFFKETYIPASFGPRPGEKVTRDIRTGSGVVNFLVSPYAPNAPVRTLQGQGVGYYLLVP